MLNTVVSTVAIIDSGIGGISVLKKLISKYNFGNYIYFADNLNMPYGNKSEKFLTKRIKAVVELLLTNYKVDLIIIACNTASCVVSKLNMKKVVCLNFDRKETYLTTPLTAKLQNKSNFVKDRTLAQLIETNINHKERLRKIIKRHIKIRMQFLSVSEHRRCRMEVRTWII